MQDKLPEKVCQVVPYMKAQNWILSYQTVEGLEKILKQIIHQTDSRLFIVKNVINKKCIND